MRLDWKRDRLPLPVRVAVLSACLLLPGTVFAAFAINETLKSYRAADELRLQSTARALSAAVSARLESYTASIATLAASPLLDDPRDAESFEVRAHPVAERMGGWIVVLGPEPDHPAMAYTGAAGVALPDRLPGDVREALTPALSEVFGRGTHGVSNLFYGPVSQRLAFAVMVPVDRPDRARRALALVVEPQTLQELLVDQDLPSGTFAAIADTGMRIMASTAAVRSKVVGESAPEWLATATMGRRSVVAVGPGLSGHTNVYALEAVDRAPGWRVTVAEPQSTQTESAWRSVQWLSAGLGAVGLTLSLAVWLARREDARDARREAAALRSGQVSVERLHRALPTVIFLRYVEEDGQSRLLYRGGDLEAVLGWPAGTFNEEDHYQAWTDLGQEDKTAFMKGVLRDGHGRVEYRLRQPDGSKRWIRVHARRLDSGSAGGGEVVGYVQDVSAERAAEGRSLAAARLAALGEISAALVHELRQPLATIAGAAENAREDAQELGAWHIDRRLERICGQALRASDILSKLRHFVRGAVDVSELEDVSLAEIVDRCLKLADCGLRSASIEISLELGDAAAPVVRAHPALLEQVLLNLVSNARDAIIAQPTPLQRRISIQAGRSSTGEALLRVTDTGGGIPPAILPRLFSPFLTTKTPEHGTGLGLWISRALVTAMGGSISVRNEAGGAVFEVTLPLSEVQREAHTFERPA